MTIKLNKPAWEVLGVSRYANAEVVRKAYLDQVTKYHPDNFEHMDDDGLCKLAGEIMKHVNRAYELMRN